METHDAAAPVIRKTISFVVRISREPSGEIAGVSAVINDMLTREDMP